MLGRGSPLTSVSSTRSRRPPVESATASSGTSSIGAALVSDCGLFHVMDALGVETGGGGEGWAAMAFCGRIHGRVQLTSAAKCKSASSTTSAINAKSGMPRERIGAASRNAAVSSRCARARAPVSSRKAVAVSIRLFAASRLSSFRALWSRLFRRNIHVPVAARSVAAIPASHHFARLSHFSTRVHDGCKRQSMTSVAAKPAAAMPRGQERRIQRLCCRSRCSAEAWFILHGGSVREAEFGENGGAAERKRPPPEALLIFRGLIAETRRGGCGFDTGGRAFGFQRRELFRVRPRGQVGLLRLDVDGKNLARGPRGEFVKPGRLDPNAAAHATLRLRRGSVQDRKSTRLNS